MKKHLTFLLTLFLAACTAALFLSFIVFKIIYPAPKEQAASKSSQTLGLADEPAIQKVKEPPSPLKFLFFGDIMLDRHVKEVMNKNGGVDYLLHNLAGEENRFFQGIDLISANLEGAVIENGAHFAPEMAYDFAFDPADVAVLKNYNFNFFTISNNHILDQGQSGFTETQVNLDKLGFDYTGCPDKKVDNCSLKIVDVNGKKIAMLGYSMVYGSLDEEKVTAQITEARKSSDLVIVNIHWGAEYESKHNNIQEKLAHLMIDSGSDLIIGHHPHVVQDVEIYKNKPIFYSLGNFIFDQYFSRETQDGLGVGVTWQSDSLEFNLFPFYSEYSKAYLMTGKRQTEWLEWLSEISDLADVKDGVIVLEQ